MVPWGRKPKFDKFAEPAIIPDQTALEALQDYVIEVRLTDKIRLRRSNLGSRRLWTVIIYDDYCEFLVNCNREWLDLEGYEPLENITHFTLARAYNLAVDTL